MFRFKQFDIIQEKSAMKVCTDSCLFGALIDPKEAQYILDIGSGTGLLSLMIAQKCKASIDGVEIDNDAALESKKNVTNSKFRKQIKIYHDSIQHFSEISNQTYDLIISNPPFFQNSLLSNDSKINKALHNDELQFDEIISIVNKHLNLDGKFWIILPEPEMQIFDSICKQNHLYNSEKINIRHDSDKKVLRLISVYQKRKVEILRTEEICIFDKNENTYSNKFKELLKEYYIIF